MYSWGQQPLSKTILHSGRREPILGRQLVISMSCIDHVKSSHDSLGISFSHFFILFTYY